MANATVSAHNYVLRRWLREKTESAREEFADAMREVFRLHQLGGHPTGDAPAEKVVVPDESGSLPVPAILTTEVVVYESPVALFVPPELSAVNLPQPARLALPPVAARVKNPATGSGRALLGVAVVDRSGRVRDRVLMDALGWGDGERLLIDVQPGALVLRPDVDGAIRMDARDQLVLPAGARALVGIASGQRVVLAALPGAGVMVVHPVEAVAAWLADLLGLVDES